jgi:hypothetical protein
MALLPEDIPESHGKSLEGEVFQTQFWIRSFTLGFSPPGKGRPERSPLTSAIKTGVPMALNCSASVLRVTVFPVPVAPAISPWRLAILGMIAISVFALAITRESGFALIFPSSSALFENCNTLVL